MSIHGQFISVRQSELESYLNDSSLLLERIETIENTDPALFHVHKAWEAIAYILTGFTHGNIKKAAPPLAWVIFGDKDVDPKLDFAYGPPGYLSDEQVKAVHVALSNISVAEIKKKYDANSLTTLKIYPGIWKDDDKARNYVGDYFEELKAFYGKAARNNWAVICYLS